MTLIEISLVLAIAGIVAVGWATLFTKQFDFYKRIRTRQQVMSQSRACMDRIAQLLRNGRAGSVVFSTPAGPPIVPNSKIAFVLQNQLTSGTTACQIYLDNGQVYSKEFRLGGTPATELLASNVTGLMFSGDTIDPAIINVSLHIDAVFDPARTPPGAVRLILPNRMVRMADTP